MKFMFWKNLFATLFIVAALSVKFTYGNFQVPYAWRNIEFSYPSDADRESAIQNGTYIPENVVLNDVDVWEDSVRGRDTGGYRIFVSTPRVRAGIPVTLSVVTSSKRGESFLLSPFPDWPSQEITRECIGIVSVDKMHIDKCGLLWIIDTGRINEFAGAQRICPPKLLIYDLRNNDNLTLRYEFPSEVLNERSSLTTTVTDSRSKDCQDTVAYIADLNGSGLVIFDLAQRTSRRVNHNLFYAYPRYGTFTISGVTFDLMDGIFGMALGPILNQDRILYFHSLASLRESWVSTSALSNTELSNQPDQLRRMFYNSDEFRDGQSSLEVMTADGIMIYSDLPQNALYCWNTATSPIKSNTQMILQDNDNFQFISGMKLKGDKLWMASNRVQNIMGNVNSTDYRYRLIFVRSVRLLLNNNGRKCLQGVSSGLPSPRPPGRPGPANLPDNVNTRKPPPRFPEI